MGADPHELGVVQQLFQTIESAGGSGSCSGSGSGGGGGGGSSSSSSSRDVDDLALRTLDAAAAERLCACRSLGSLQVLREPAPATRGGANLGTWMIWVVHRVALNDPTLRVVDFRNLPMPSPSKEPRIGPKLFRVLAQNTHLEELLLSCANVHGGEQAELLSQSLASNHHLRVLNLECNQLKSQDIRAIVSSLAGNTALKELRCSDQFCEHAIGGEACMRMPLDCGRMSLEEDRATLVAVHDMLQTNRTLLKLGMDLTERHYRDQILKALIRNTELERQRKRRGRRHEEVQPSFARGPTTRSPAASSPLIDDCKLRDRSGSSTAGGVADKFAGRPAEHARGGA